MYGKHVLESPNNTCDLYGPRNPCQQIQELVTSKLLLLMRPIHAHRWVRPGDLGGYRNNCHTSENEREILGKKGEGEGERGRWAFRGQSD